MDLLLEEKGKVKLATENLATVNLATAVVNLLSFVRFLKNFLLDLSLFLMGRAIDDVASSVTERDIEMLKVLGGFPERPRLPPPLIEGTIASDSLWKTRYFFVVKDSLGEAGNHLVGGWSNKGLGPVISQIPEQAERLPELLKFPVEERTFAAPTEVLPLDSRASSRTNSMSTAPARSSNLSDEDAMDRLKNRKRSAASSGQSQIERVPRKNLRSSSIPTTIDITTDSPRDEVLVSFPADFLAEEGLEGGIWPAADKLVFPAAQKRLKGQDPEVILNHAVQLSLQLSQSCIAARDSLRTVATLQDKVARLQKDNLSHQAKLEREKQSGWMLRAS
ncbi:uncharacterized protein LOC125498357 [Beta vulgaris subsp. vulgaris]|uniref:uncharacterized protein LOC125498357 n=1 Tax=Beta vulgaris subsp. vulgaris TaxID=3555 RepID=UPI0025494BE7|nr:uncharacterized protein LOC125498357 [Beta vulgaris subsp. vulgaris]